MAKKEKLNIDALRQQFNDVCEEYLKLFCKKHELKYEPDCWVAGDVGTVAMVGDYFFGLDEIRYDIDNNCQEEAIFEWYDYVVRIGSLGCEKQINFESWVKGSPRPYSEEKLQEIERLHKEVEKAKELLEVAIKDAPFNPPTEKQDVINKLVNWVSGNVCKYVKMNKEVIWTSADLNDDFRYVLEETLK